MRWVLAVVLLAGCDKSPVPPQELRPPSSRLMAPTHLIAPLPKTAQGNEEMWTGYGQCRLAWSDEADLRQGLVGYVRAMQGR